MPMPDKFRNAPELFVGLDLFYIAFMDMSSCRQMGYMAIGPIDWLTINAYCIAYQLQGEQREDMFYFIGQMDVAYLNRTKIVSKPAPAPPPSRKGKR
jgi:hypothetical protein